MLSSYKNYKKMNFYLKESFIKGINFNSSKLNRPYSKVIWVNEIVGESSFADNNIYLFEFRPLEQVKTILLSSGYSSEEVEKTIRGLSELPEYEGKSFKRSSK